MTNGVSFSLVVGACCLVKFSNALYQFAPSSTTGMTLNIQSTGAKYISAKYTPMSDVPASELPTIASTGTRQGSTSFANANYFYRLRLAMNPVLFMYDGSTYQTITMAATCNYLDSD